MSEEGEAQAGVRADAAEPLVDDVRSLADGVRAQVGEFSALQVPLHLLDRVAVVGVGREGLDDQPVSVGEKEPLHGPAAVGGEPVPDERDLVAVEMVVELGQELHQGFVVVGTGAEAKHQ